MAYAISKGYKIANEGLQDSIISKVEVLLKEKVKIKGKEAFRDIIQVVFRTSSGNAQRRYYLYINNDSPLAKLIMAIHGEVPDNIVDIEDFLINEEVVIEVKHNISIQGKTFANVVDTFPMDEEDEFNEDSNEIEEEEEEIDIDLDFDEVEEEVYIDLDLDENKPTGSTRRRRNIKL